MKSAAFVLLIALPLLAAPGGFTVFDGPNLFVDDDTMLAGDFISASWSSVFGDDMELAIGTTPFGEEILPFTSVGLVNQHTTTTAALASTTYYVSIRSVTSGSPGTPSTSDGIFAVPLPSLAVYDGPSAGFDEDIMLAGDPIAASWDAVAADTYELAIGTTPGGQDIQAFTDVGLVTQFFTSVTAVANTTYFVTVRAVVGGSPADTATSDGVFAENIRAVPTSGVAPLTVHFFAQQPGIALYEWDFDVPFFGGTPEKLKSSRSITPPGGPGGVDYSSPSSGDAAFTYAFPGSYEARLTMHDPQGNTSTRTFFIDVAPSPDAPPVGVGVDIPSGPAPLTVTFTAAVSATVGAYFWDFNQDGVYDATTETPTLTHTFTRPNIYNVVATVFDEKGVGSSSPPIFVDVQSPAVGDAPVMTSSQAVPGTYRVGDIVPFSAGGDPGATGTLMTFHWDFDGNGEIDLVTATGNATYRFTAPGFYSGLVFCGDSENLSSTPSGINVQIDLANDQDRVWLVEPADKLKVFGNFVTLTAVAVPADQVTGVDFFYRPVGGSVWTLINPAPVTGPPVTEFGTHWDVRALPQGAPGFELMATASFGARTPANSPLIGVTVDAVAPDLVENSGSPFTKLKVQGVNPNAQANLGISRDTTIQLQAGTTFTYDQMRLERRSENPHPVESNLQGLRFVPGHFRKKSFAGGQKLQKPSKITMYLNTDSDLLADGTDLNTSTFKIMKFNETSLRWEPLYNQTFNPTQKLIKAFSATTGDVAIAVVSTRTDASSSSAACGLAGIEVLLAGLAVAALARRLRSRHA